MYFASYIDYIFVNFKWRVYYFDNNKGSPHYYGYRKGKRLEQHCFQFSSNDNDNDNNNDNDGTHILESGTGQTKFYLD